MSAPTRHHFDDRESLFAALADHLAQRVDSALCERPRAALALSGGSTPQPLYCRLREAALDWARLDITLTDERFVAPDHADSNEAMLRRCLLRGDAAAARFYPLMRPTDNPGQAARQAHAALGELDWPLDVVLLGMGDDRHTASLFPDAAELADATAETQTQRCLALHPASSAHPRLSLSLNALSANRELILLICGEAKRQTLERALQGADGESPIALALQRCAGRAHIYWSP